MRGRFLVLILLLSCAAAPARAELRHYTVAPAAGEEKKEAGGGAAPASKNFVVTPVQDCFSRLKPGEANEVRRDFESPWLECQNRLRAREEEAARKAAAAAKDGKDSRAEGTAPEKQAAK